MAFFFFAKFSLSENQKLKLMHYCNSICNSSIHFSLLPSITCVYSMEVFQLFLLSDVTLTCMVHWKDFLERAKVSVLFLPCSTLPQTHLVHTRNYPLTSQIALCCLNYQPTDPTHTKSYNTETSHFFFFIVSFVPIFSNLIKSQYLKH